LPLFSASAILSLKIAPPAIAAAERGREFREKEKKDYFVHFNTPLF